MSVIQFHPEDIQLHLEHIFGMEDLHGAKFWALTNDGWTSRAQDGYITTTAHYLDDNWALQTRVLDTNALQEAHNEASRFFLKNGTRLVSVIS